MYINKLEFNEMRSVKTERTITANVYNPTLVVTKRWSSNMHSLIYSGSVIAQHFGSTRVQTEWQIYANPHYMI